MGIPMERDCLLLPEWLHAFKKVSGLTVKEFIEKSLPWRLHKFLSGLFFHFQILWWISMLRAILTLVIYRNAPRNIFKINNFNPSECLISEKYCSVLLGIEKQIGCCPCPKKLSTYKYYQILELCFRRILIHLSTQ